jgi:hypothetical protein
MRISRQYNPGRRAWKGAVVVAALVASASATTPLSVSQTSDPNAREVSIASVHVIVRDAKNFATLATSILGARLSRSRVYDSLYVPGLRIDLAGC